MMNPTTLPLKTLYAPVACSLLALGFATTVSAQGVPPLVPNPFNLVDLGTLPNGVYGDANGISADGSVVVGISTNSNWESSLVIWNSANAITQLSLPLSATYGYTNGVSGDGTVIVGDIYSTTDYRNHAVRWDTAGSMLVLNAAPGLTNSGSAARAANSDGSIIVGSVYSTGINNGTRAFRWDAIGGMQNIGYLGGDLRYSGYAFSDANDVSADGSVVVGTSSVATGAHAFRWVQLIPLAQSLNITPVTNGIGGVMEDLGTLGGTYSYANAVNSGGNVVVGVSNTGNNNTNHAFRWTAGGTGMQDLGTLGGANSVANDVSADGSIVVGDSRLSGQSYNNHATRWTIDALGGILVEDLGTLSRADTYSSASGVSADGSVIVGSSGDGESNRPFIYRTSMLDLINTQTAIGESAANQGGAVEVSNAVAGAMLGRELEVSRVGTSGAVSSSKGGANARAPMAIRLEGALTSNSDIGQQTSAGVTAAIGLGDRLNVGAFVLTGNQASALTGFGVDTNQTAFGGYIRSRATDRTGLTWKLAVENSDGPTTITRAATLTNTEAGVGSTTLTTLAGSAEIGYGFAKGKSIVTPFLRVSSASTTRGGYTETNAITFPVTYDPYQQDIVTATLGVNGRTVLSPTLTVRYGVGLETDLSRSANPVTGTSAVPGMTVFSVAAPTVLNATRAYASAGVSHAFANGSEISLDTEVRQSAYTATPTFSAVLGYEIRF